MKVVVGRRKRGHKDPPLQTLPDQKHTTAGNLIVPGQYNFYRFGINAVFFLQNSRAERDLSIAIFDGHNSLQHNRSGIEMFVDEMQRASGEFYPIFQSLPLRFESRERWQQRGMYIYNALRKCRHKPR